MTDLEIMKLIEKSYSADQDSWWDKVYYEVSTHGVHLCRKYIDGYTVLIFRGSVTDLDWWRDLISGFGVTLSGYTELGQIPFGFQEGMGFVLADLLPHIVGPCIIGGHSLGAAHASIFTGLLTSKSFAIDRIVLAGCPRPGTSTLRKYVSALSIGNYRNGDGNDHDYVTDVPLWPFCPVYPYTDITGGESDDPGPFMYHHIQYYVAGLEALASHSGG